MRMGDDWGGEGGEDCGGLLRTGVGRRGGLEGIKRGRERVKRRERYARWNKRHKCDKTGIIQMETLNIIQ